LGLWDYWATQGHIAEDWNHNVNSIENTVFVFVIASELPSVNRLKH
jgi:hypothetical protein